MAIVDLSDIIAAKKANPQDEDAQEEYNRWREAFEHTLTTIEEAAQSGTPVVSESEWEDYARDYVEDMANIPVWLEMYVDFERFANDLKLDYSRVEVDGETYYFR